jgi:hypothetical protein
MHSKKTETKKAKKNIVIKTSQKEVVAIFHKKDSRYVISQEVRQVLNERLEIKKVDNVNQTTVVLKDKLIEIIWKN